MSICKLDCCTVCAKLNECGGCERCGGRPFGGYCPAAEIILSSGMDAYLKLKQALIDEINALGIPGLHTQTLNLLNGFCVNLSYPLPNGLQAQFLNDRDIYFGNRIECEGSNRCYGVIASRTFILVCEYGYAGADPNLLLYKAR